MKNSAIKVVIGIDDIVFRISKKDLRIVVEEKPDARYKIKDIDRFIYEFGKQILKYSTPNSSEMGMLAIEELFDEIIDEVYINAEGDDFIIDEYDEQDKQFCQ